MTCASDSAALYKYALFGLSNYPHTYDDYTWLVTFVISRPENPTVKIIVSDLASTPSYIGLRVSVYRDTVMQAYIAVTVVN